MKTGLLVLLVLSRSIAADLFVGGTGGYHTYRIPALLVTQKGTLLAFCEARKNSGRDDGDIDLAMRRSTNGGKSWSPMTLVYEEGGAAPVTIGNPSPVQDRHSGVVHLLFSRNNQRMFRTQSRDEGKTWSAPVEITAALEGVDFAWTRLGVGPGHAIQLRGGRLLVPVWLNDKIKQGYRSAAVYSDDGGATWKAGKVVPSSPKANECMFYERADGSVAATLRTAAHHRTQAVSRDGGLTWGAPEALPSLPDPVCQASVVALPAREQVIFANPADPARRVNLTLRRSQDDGASWTAARVLFPGPSGYSDLAAGKGGVVLCLFESGEQRATERIRFERVPVRSIR